MSNPLRMLGTALAAFVVIAGWPAVSAAQIYTRPVYVTPPPTPPRVVYYTPCGPVVSAYGPPPYVVPPTRYSFYEVPSPVGVFPTTTLYYPAAPAGVPVYIPGNYAPNYRYTPGYYVGYPTAQYFRY
jgi:hypothetical protein